MDFLIAVSNLVGEEAVLQFRHNFKASCGCKNLQQKENWFPMIYLQQFFTNYYIKSSAL